MKKTLLKFFAVGLMAGMILAGTGLFAQVVLSSGQQNGIVLTENSFNGIRVTNSFAEFDHFDVNTKNGLFTEISASGYTFTWEEGFPKLPVMRRLIEIPLGAKPEVAVLSYDVTEYNLNDLGIQHQLMPTQPAVTKSGKETGDFVINSSVYSANKYHENTLARVEVIGIMRNQRMARLEISPVEYNPVEGKIRVYSNVVVDVKFTDADYSATSQLNDKTRSPYFGGFNYLNQLPKGTNDRGNLTRYPIKMVIVSDPMFQETLQPYIAWKTRKGFTMIEAYTNNPEVGTTTSSIKSYLQGLYNAGTTEDPAPTFVLFVGDVAQIPAFSQSGHVTDLYYCEYTNDVLPEVYYGRFSATSIAQLQPQIDKTLMYEQYQFPDPSFLNEVVMVSGMDGSFAAVHGNGQINYGTNHYFNEAHGLTSHTYLYPVSGSSAAAIRQDVSNGVAYGNYTAHGGSSGWSDPAFEISHIPALQNYGKYPLLVGNCCLTSTYNTNSFGEELLRAQDKGAVGYIGASNSTYWDEDFYFGVGVGTVSVNPLYENTTLGSYDRAFHTHGEAFEEWFTTQAQMFVAGNLAVTESGSPRITYYWQVYCLMGDPSLMIYFSAPPEMAVTYEPLMPLASQSFIVNAEPYAYVAISKDGVLHGSALADDMGVAEVMLDPITVPGEAEIIITAQNKQPYIGTVLVASPEGPYVLMQSQVVNDVSGNNSQTAEHGETFGFNMTLKNVGNTESQELTVTMASASPYVVVNQATATWPNIQPGELITLEGVFEVVATEWLPDQHPAQFTLEISNGTEIWNAGFTIKLNAPVLVSGGITIDDFIAGTGNGNGRLDPGENVVLSLQINNTGHCTAPETEAFLFTESEWIEIDAIHTLVGDIDAAGAMYAMYNLAVSPDAPIGTVVSMYLSNSSGVYNSSKIYSPKIGLIIEDFETGDFTAYPWVNDSPVPWTTTTTSVNGGTYAARSGAISHNSSTSLQVTMDVSAADNISFARRVSSESGYDFLKFYIDGVEKGSWSGDVAWGNETYPVTPGMRTFKWTYSKDVSVSSGSDAAFIDDINFPSSNGGGSGTEFAVKAFAYPATLCGEGEVNLFAFVENASATGNILYSWTPAEMLSNPDIYNPVAWLTDTTVFTIVANQLMSTSTAELEILVGFKPETPEVEQNEIELISSAETGNQWYNSDGAIEGAVNQIYVPEVSDYYYVIVTAENGCSSEPSAEIYFSMVNVSNPEQAGALKLYPNPFRSQLTIEFGLKSQTQVRISLMNLLGQDVSTIVEGSLSGNQSITFDAKGLNPGIYFLKMETGDKTEVRKVVLSE